MELELGIAPGHPLAQLAPGKAQITRIDAFGPRARGDVIAHQVEQRPRLRWQLVKRGAQHRMGQGIGRDDVVKAGLDVFERGQAGPLQRPGRALMLVQQGDRPDQPQILAMVAPGPGFVVKEGQVFGERVDHLHRPYQPLRIVVELADRCPVLARRQPRQRLLIPLPGMDGAGLVAALVDGQHQAAVGQLLVEVDGGRGQHQRHRPLNLVFLRHQLARHRVFAGGGDGERALALQQLERIGGMARAFLLGNGQRLVLEVRLAKVEQALAGHCRVGDPLFLGHQIKHPVHQRRLARRAGRLDQNGKRTVELAAQGGQIGAQRVLALADNAERRDVGDDAPQQVGSLEPGQRLGLLGGADRGTGRCGRGGAQHVLLHPLQRQQHLAHVALDNLYGEAQLARRLGDERAPRFRGQQVQPIDVEGRAAPDHEVDPHRLTRRIARQAPRAPHPVADADDDLARAHLGLGGRRRCRWDRPGMARLGDRIGNGLHR